MRYFAILFLFVFIYASEPRTKQLFNIKTIEVKKDKYAVFKSFYGTAQIDESKITEVVLRIDGYVGDIKIDKKYSYVKKGDELFKIYSPQLYIAGNELLSALDSSYEKLKDSIITKMRLMGADESVINEIIKEKKIKEFLPFYSSAEGFVTEKNIYKGSSVKAGELLYRIADYKKMWVLAKIYESDIDFIKNGQTAKIKFEGDKNEYFSKVDFIYPAVKNEEKTIDVRFVVDNKDFKINPGSFAKVTVFDKIEEILLLPSTAVITKGENHFVFVKSEYEGEYEPKKIVAKRLDSKNFKIISGLKEGDEVVNNSLFLFDSDAQINGFY